MFKTIPLLTGLIVTAASADTIHVRPDCIGGLNNGTSWTDAYCGP